MLFCPNSLSCPKKLSSEYQLYACGNFFGHSSILNKIAILGQPPRNKSFKITLNIERLFIWTRVYYRNINFQEN
jgi:hypothetical protein